MGETKGRQSESSTAGRRGEPTDRWDQVSDQRDHAGERTQAESDRDTASEDRVAGAQERELASLDRDTALADRQAGASERTQAESDRDTASTDREASANERYSASQDGLTGVYNRAAGLFELGREIARARRTEQPLVLAFLDVDQLKAINDAGGHAAGDRVLVKVAETVKAHLRSYDLILRYGGDEFICAISGLNTADVTRRLTRVNAVLTDAPDPGSVTAGLVMLQPADTAEDLIARADKALYRERQQRPRRLAEHAPEGPGIMGGLRP